MACSTCGVGVPKAPGLGGGPMTKAALRAYWMGLPGKGVMQNPGPGGEYDEVEPDDAESAEAGKVESLLAAESLRGELEKNPSWLLPPPPDLAVVGLGPNASNLSAVAPFPMARTGYVQNPDDTATVAKKFKQAAGLPATAPMPNVAPPIPPGMGTVAVPVEPPGWLGLGQTCWRDDDCRRGEYCHGGMCVTSPWAGRGAGTQVEVSNPSGIGPLSIALQATGQIPTPTRSNPKCPPGQVLVNGECVDENYYQNLTTCNWWCRQHPGDDYCQDGGICFPYLTTSGRPHLPGVALRGRRRSMRRAPNPGGGPYTELVHPLA